MIRKLVRVVLCELSDHEERRHRVCLRVRPTPAEDSASIKRCQERVDVDCERRQKIQDKVKGND